MWLNVPWSQYRWQSCIPHTCEQTSSRSSWCSTHARHAERIGAQSATGHSGNTQSDLYASPDPSPSCTQRRKSTTTRKHSHSAQAHHQRYQLDCRDYFHAWTGRIWRRVFYQVENSPSLKTFKQNSSVSWNSSKAPEYTQTPSQDNDVTASIASYSLSIQYLCL